jgi:two-component system sensor histidine kinase AtoS
MIKQYKSSIKKELLKIILSIVIIATLIGYIVFIIEYMKKKQNEDIRLTKIISKVISQDVAKIVFDNDISTATDITTALKAFLSLDELIIYNSTGKILFEYSKSEISKSEKFNKSLLGKAIIKNGKLEVYDKLLYKDIFIAYVKYSFKLESLKDILVDSMPYLIFILIIMLFVAYFLAKYGAQKFTAPIINLVKFLENIIQNKSFLHNRVTIEEKNEIGLLYEEVNTMLETIEYSITHDNLTGLYNLSLIHI